MMRSTVLTGAFNAAEIFLYTYPGLCVTTILSQQSTDKSLAQSVLWHTLSTMGPYTVQTDLYLSKSCPINSGLHRWTPIKLETHLTDDNWKQEDLSLIWRLCTYVIYFCFLINLQEFQANICQPLVFMGYCTQTFGVTNVLNPFWNKTVT